MLLNKTELSALTHLAKFNQLTKEDNDFESYCKSALQSHNFAKEEKVNIFIHDSILLRFAGYSLNWVKDDVLGLRLQEELYGRI